MKRILFRNDVQVKGSNAGTTWQNDGRKLPRYAEWVDMAETSRWQTRISTEQCDNLALKLDFQGNYWSHEGVLVRKSLVNRQISENQNKGIIIIVWECFKIRWYWEDVKPILSCRLFKRWLLFKIAVILYIFCRDLIHRIGHAAPKGTGTFAQNQGSFVFDRIELIEMSD